MLTNHPTASEAVASPGAPLSNRLSVLAAQARAANGDYLQSRRNARRAFLVAGAVLAEARLSAKRGEWGPFLVEAGIEERSATNMIRLHRGGWTGESLDAAGGVRAALDVQAARDRLAVEEAAGAATAEGPGDAGDALRDGPDAFMAFCAARDSAPADVAAAVVSGLDPESDGEEAEKFSGNAGEAEADSPNAGGGPPKWNPARPSSNEWYSPAWVVEPAREVLGRIDLDPASCEVANATIRADRYFTANNDGLAQPWAGRVWMNPPYSSGDLILWVTKLLDAMDSGAVPEAVALMPAYVETRMAQTALARCEAVCFPAQRVKFERPGLPTRNPPAGSMILYFGPHPDRFRDAFSNRGAVLPGRWG